jgi:hypothetical protein
LSLDVKAFYRFQITDNKMDIQTKDPSRWSQTPSRTFYDGKLIYGFIGGYDAAITWNVNTNGGQRRILTNIGFHDFDVSTLSQLRNHQNLGRSLVLA